MPEIHQSEHEALHDIAETVGGKKRKTNPSATPSVDFHQPNHHAVHRALNMMGYERVKGGSSITRTHHGNLEHHTHTYHDGSHTIKVTHRTAAMGYSGGGYQGSTIEHVSHGKVSQHSEEETEQFDETDVVMMGKRYRYKGSGVGKMSHPVGHQILVGGGDHWKHIAKGGKVTHGRGKKWLEEHLSKLHAEDSQHSEQDNQQEQTPPIQLRRDAPALGPPMRQRTS